jgi:hypothetical protein
MAINQNLGKVASIRFAAVGITFLYYAIAARLLPQETAAKLFFLTTIITSIELFINGASESLILQHQYTRKAEKALKTRQLIAITGISAASLYQVEYACTAAGLINSFVRLRTVKARASNDSSAIFLDGLPQAILNIIIVSIATEISTIHAVFTPLLSAAIIMPLSTILLKQHDAPRLPNVDSGNSSHTSLAVYAQLLTASLTSLALGIISGPLYRELFLAQRFGDSMINSSRVLQWTKVETIRRNANAVDLSRREILIILGLTITSTAAGFIYGKTTALGSAYFLYLPVFILTGTFTVLLANLTQAYIQSNSTDLLLKIRTAQLMTVAIGALIANWIHEAGVLVFAAALAQITVYIYVKRRSLHRTL